MRLPAIAFLATLLFGCSPEAERAPTRVVLVTLDTLRLDAFEPASTPGMPHTRAFAERGRVFTAFYSATSTTQPTHATVLTGLQPWEHGVERNGIPLQAHLRTVPEILKEHGFETAAVVASFPLHSRFGFDQGFDRYDDAFTKPARGAMWEEGIELSGNFDSPAEVITDRAIELLDGARGDRQFFWFHYFDPHSPYGDSTPGEAFSAPARQRARAPGRLRTLQREESPHLETAVARARELYANDVAYLDRQLERLWQRLAQDDIETHVVVASDHGESFGEGGVFGHGSRVSPEQIHVPCFIVSPRVDSGARVETCGSVDLAPTLLALAGVDVALPGGLDLTGTAPGDAEAIGMRRTYVETGPDDGPADARLLRPRFFVARSGRVLTGGSDGVFVDDTDEAATADEAAELALRFAAWEKSLRSNAAAELLDDETQRALGALGYTRGGDDDE